MAKANIDARQQLRHAAERLAEFMRWWGSGLIKGLPGSVRRHFVAERAELLFGFGGSDIGLSLRQGQMTSFLGTLDPLQPLDAQLPALDFANTEVTLVFRAEQVLRRELEWPLEALSGFTQALRYQLDRLLPVDKAAVRVGHRVLGRNPTNKTFRFELAAVPRHEVDTWLQAIGDSGLRVASVAFGIIGSDARYPVWSEESPSTERSRRRVVWAAVATLVLVGLAIYLPVERKARVLELLDAEIADVRGGAESVRAQLDEQAARQQARAAVYRDFSTEHSRSVVLESLAALLPDSAYLTYLTLSGRMLLIDGEAESTTTVVEQLEPSALFESVEFVAPVSRNAQTGMEKFTLKIWLSPKEESRAG